MSVESLAGKVRELPSLPVVVTEIVAMIDRGEVDIVALERKIVQDQSLAARILRIANSPFYGVSGKVGTVKEGLVVLGLAAVRNLVIAASVMKQFPVRGGVHLNRIAFWQHSIGTSITGRVLARRLGMDKEIAFTAGLLHDIGKLALDCYFSGDYTQVLLYRQDKDCHLMEAEAAVLGFDHAQAGGVLARHWKLPSPIVAAIEGHHSPDGCSACPIVDLIHVSDVVCRGLDIGNGGEDLLPGLHPPVMGRLGLDWSDLKAYFAEIEACNQAGNLLLADLL